MTKEFSQLGLNGHLLDAIDDAGYKTATPIQVQAIPKVLEGGDLLAAAQTGTGKTAGFTLPILHLLEQRAQDNQSAKARKAGTPACLILTPTRELAAQIKASVDLYGKYLDSTSMVVFGGVSINPQISALRKRIDILIATPGRLLDLCNQRKVDLSKVEIVVLDEADRMLDMGFIHDIKRVMKLLPQQRQTLLFSATFSNDIRTLARNMLNNPAEVSVARHNTASELVEQVVHWVDKAGKRALLSHTITTGQWDQVLVFTRTKHGADKLVKQLIQDGIEAMAIHGNKSQNARTRALQNFKQGSLNVLVATDIAARGLDIDQLSLVVNYELPNVAEDYVHRIGRTGRAGSSGNAISLVNAEELKLLRGIEKLISRKIPVIEVDGFTGHNETAEEISIRREDNQAREKERRKANPRRRGGQSQSTTAKGDANGNRAQTKKSSASGSGNGNSQRRKRRS